MASFAEEERRRIEAALARGDPAVACPRCDGPLRREEVAPPPGVPYVRQRAVFTCPRCRRSTALDVRGAGPP